ncbi:FAD-binding oxidoreductase [Actinobacteria bacterium YIM 96077]|uniref:FAD-binding oxidoreductase n=1 Tax=Phytoactinopolyspora halophila TaxID=1981511 RepID=A0A329R4X7_9ACTN|nr:FAD-binding oxidoreductase [Phytoactinopolyspora halophila]AYY12184.1 FAD-binding oxidoreductase [Actinobacteria bacterium YIM 96077]RAW18582.1 FAD-binding oxidoreductase [Phytoactinopolyspora halophila]
MTIPATSDVTATLRSTFAGPVHVPGDHGYETGRGSWHRTIDPHPAVVAEAAGADDVHAAVRAAREHGVPFAVQATGHGTYVPADGGVLLKTGRLNHVEVDPESRTVRAGAGALWSDVVDAAAPHGLAPLSGTLSIGVAGYTLGGGAGYLSRTFGFAADSLVRAEIVVSDGRLLTVSGDEHPDLFWAIRGGSGNFGVATSLELLLFPVDRVYAGMSYYPTDRAEHVLRFYRDWAVDEPDELNTSITVMRIPDAPHVPDPIRDRPVLAIRPFCLAGSVRARTYLTSLLNVAGPPLVDGIAEYTFAEASAVLSGPPHPPMAVDQRFELFRDLPDDVISAVVDSVDTAVTAIELRHWGGAMARPSAHAGPIGHRDTPFSLTSVAMAADPDGLSAGSAALDQITSWLRPHTTGGSFVNFLADPARTASAYTPDDYRRLTEVKRDWDPDNVFRSNHHIRPAAQGAR